MTDITEQIRLRIKLRARARADVAARMAALFRPARSVVATHDPRDPLAAALRHTARLSGLGELTVPPPGAALPQRLERTAALSRVRIVSCALVGEWWREEFVPLVARGRDDGAYWSVYRTPNGARVAWNGATGETFAVDAGFAAALESVAWHLVRLFPAGRIGMRAILRHLLYDVRKNLRIIILLSAMTSLLSCVSPLITSLVFSDVVPNADRPLLGQLVGLSALFAAMTCLVQYVYFQYVERMRTSSSLSLQLALFDRILRLPVGFFRDYQPAELASRMTSSVEAIKLCGASIIKIMSNLIQMAAPAAMMFWCAPPLAGAVLGVIVLHVALDAWLYAKAIRYRGEFFAQSGRLTGVMERYVRGSDKIRAAGAADSVFGIWARGFAEAQQTFLTSARWTMAMAVMRAILPALLFCSSAAVVVWGYLHRVASGGLTLADFAGFTSAVAIVSSQASWILYCLDPIMRSIPSFRWTLPILEAEEDVAEDSPGLTAESFKGAVELDHVTFAYPGGRTILDDVSIKAAPGEFVAITGESGAGKSTALRLMLRFERPQAGVVLYDGKDIATCDMRALRAGFGVVMQSAATMPDTIFRNIVGYGGAHTEEEVWQAARLAGCEEAIREFPQQLQTVLSEGTVSGGQRQRFLLAQAFIRKPKIFFLDEATSALDNATQKVVVDSLATMKATRVVIAHRLSTIRGADRIYYLDRGRIAEVGTFDELMARGGLFARAARRQMLEEKGE